MADTCPVWGAPPHIALYQLERFRSDAPPETQDAAVLGPVPDPAPDPGVREPAPKNQEQPLNAARNEKHLDLLQDVIKRLAGNSFLIKGWSVTLVTALW